MAAVDVDGADLRRRAQVHAALGDPARLAIVDALLFGDASPGALAEMLSLPTNLFAHHVKVLEAAGLIRRTRSEGDRRRTYLRLEFAALTSLLWRPRLEQAGRLVFVCTRNSARSQLAAALWRDRTGQPAVSAGTRPAPDVHPRTVQVARRHGLAVTSTGTASMEEVVHDDDVIIAVCDNAFEELAERARPRLHWSIPDPVRHDSDAAFEQVYREISERIDRLVPAVTDASRAAPQPEYTREDR